MEDFNESSWGNIVLKTLKNLMAKETKNLMTDTKRKPNHFSSSLKQLLNKCFATIAVATSCLFVAGAVKYIDQLMQSSARDLFPDRPTVQLGTADPVAVDKDSSNVLTHKKLIKVDSVAEVSARRPAKSNSDQVIVKVPAGQSSLCELPDGSKVLLNSMSMLQYSRSEFRKNKRKIHLQGQAYFEVQHDEQRPFCVETDSINVTVIGTTFEIRCIKGERRSRVTLRTGRVLVEKIKGQDKVILTPGESAVLDNTSGKFASEKQDPLIAFGWIRDYYILQSLSLYELCAELSRLYGDKFVIDTPPPPDKRFFLRFYRDKPLPILMEDLHENERLSYYRTEDNVWHIR